MLGRGILNMGTRFVKTVIKTFSRIKRKRKITSGNGPETSVSENQKLAPTPICVAINETETEREIDSKSNKLHDVVNHESTMSTELPSELLTAPLTLNSGRRAQIFALLIGINIYNAESTAADSIDGWSTRASMNDGGAIPKFDNLRCAVLDAQNFKSYLQDDLNVPEDHITFLQDGQATRDDITAAFERLAQDKRICQDDAIFIFYAGHGIRALPPSWRRGPEHPDMIELLVPSDFNRNPDNYRRMGIPDYTMAALVNKISMAKGNNITIVFDCCHSASALRGSQAFNDSQVMFRTQSNFTSLFEVPDDLDNELICTTGVRGMKTVDSLKCYGNASYVYFSACSSTESAAEESNKGGRFSQALLAILKKHGPTALTCTEIIQRLPPIAGQHPECDGGHKNRHIFQSYVPSNSTMFFEVYNAPMENSTEYDFSIREGQAHGLALNDELVIFKGKSKEDQKEPVGTVYITAFDIYTNTTKLKTIPDVPSFNLPCQPAPALLRKSNETHLTLYVDPYNAQLNSRVRQLLTKFLSNVAIMYSPGAAQIGLSVDKTTNRLRFDVRDSALTRRNVKLQSRFTSNDDQTLRNVLKGLAHYYWHLKRTSQSPLPLDGVSISFVGVRDTNMDEDRFVTSTNDHNFVDQSGCIEVTVNDSDSGDSGPYYGFKLEHTTSEKPKLYPILFYFDNIEFTINYAFNPAIGSSPEAPWSQSAMSIGYGSGVGATVPPISFTLNPGYDVEAGFFKLFLSNKPLNLDSMLQEESPFASHRGLVQKAPQFQHRFAHQWAEKTLPVIIRRSRAYH